MARHFRMLVNGKVVDWSVQNNLPAREGNETNSVLIDTLVHLGASWETPTNETTVVLNGSEFDSFVHNELEDICNEV